MKQKQKRPFGVHPADLPENRNKKSPDYLKVKWASEDAKLFAKLLDEKYHGR